MEDKITGVVPEEGTITQEAEVSEQPQETQPESVPIGDYQKLQTELEGVKRAQAGSDRMVSQLKKGRGGESNAPQSAAQMDYLNKKLDLILRQQSGQFDETSGTVDQQLGKLETEYGQKRQALEQAGQYKTHVEASLESIREIFESAGIDPDDGSVLEVKEVQALYNEALNKGEHLDSVIAKAAKTIASKVRATQPDEAEIERRIRQQIHEEGKKSPSLKVETGGPMSPVNANATAKGLMKSGWEEIHKE